MAKGSSVAVRERMNYYVWALKMKAMLRVEGQWGITEMEQIPAVFPTVIDGETLTEILLKKIKVLACCLLQLSVSDNLVDLIAKYSDPALIWKTLKE